MAGGGGGLELPERQKRGKQSARKKKKRVGFHIDMTPLVDITFLLLTFFMFTTTMAAPQILEMSIPPEMYEQVEVKESELMTLRVRKDGAIFWNIGNEKPKKIDISNLKDLAIKENLKEPVRNKLITSLKVSDDAPYGVVVSILDQLNLAEVKITEVISSEKDENGKPIKRKRKFTIAPFTEEDAKLIENDSLNTAGSK